MFDNILVRSSPLVPRLTSVTDNKHLHLLVAMLAMSSHATDKVVLALLVKRDSHRSALPLVRLFKAGAVVEIFLARHLDHIVTIATPLEGDLLPNHNTLLLRLGVPMPL